MHDMENSEDRITPSVIRDAPVSILRDVLLPWEDILIGPREIGGNDSWIIGYGTKWIATRLRFLSRPYEVNGMVCYWEIPYHVIEYAYTKNKLIYIEIYLVYGERNLRFKVSYRVDKQIVRELISSIIEIPVDMKSARIFWNLLSRGKFKAKVIRKS